MSCYDEFESLEEAAAEFGIPWRAPRVRRVDHGPVSTLVWGDGPPELVLLHGGAQNAHTWDVVALALDRPLVAIDLPGHGHSAWRDTYAPAELAAAIAPVISGPLPIVGMSLGGLTAMQLAGDGYATRLLLVDVTPGVDEHKAAPILAFVHGQRRFASFDELVAYTVAGNPTRSEASLRRGARHNAKEEADGSWVWRHHFGSTDLGERPSFGSLWDLPITVPLLLVRGGNSGVVSDADEAEFRRRFPQTRVVVVEGAGHSVQGDKPLELARLIGDFV